MACQLIVWVNFTGRFEVVYAIGRGLLASCNWLDCINYIDINMTPFKIDNLTINTTSWSQQRILTDLSPHVLFSALKIQLIDDFDQSISLSEANYLISNSKIVGVANSQGDGAALYCSKTVGLSIISS